jgi:hypothetical protein
MEGLKKDTRKIKYFLMKTLRTTRATTCRSFSILILRFGIPTARNPYRRGRHSTVDLLVPTSSEQVLFSTRIYFFFTKRTILTRRSTVLDLPFQQGVPAYCHCYSDSLASNAYLRPIKLLPQSQSKTFPISILIPYCS